VTRAILFSSSASCCLTNAKILVHKKLSRLLLASKFSIAHVRSARAGIEFPVKPPSLFWSFLMSRIRILAILAVAAILPLASSSLYAQEASYFSTGSTSLALDPTLVAGLTDYNVTVTGQFPATLSNNTASFPIAAGGLDLDTLVGVVYHSGGLTFTAGSTVVSVSELGIVSEGGGTPVLVYGLVTVNGTVAGLYPLFNLNGSVKTPLTGSTLDISNLELTLSSQAAALLNNSFGFDGFSAGEKIGVATVTGTVASATSSAVPVNRSK
jgi:hypothetical protein